MGSFSENLLKLSFILWEVPCHVDDDFISVDELHKGSFAVEGVESQRFLL